MEISTTKVKTQCTDVKCVLKNYIKKPKAKKTNKCSLVLYNFNAQSCNAKQHITVKLEDNDRVLRKLNRLIYTS